MQKMLISALLLTGICVSAPAVAAGDFYSTAGYQYSRVGEPVDQNDSGFLLGAGYQIDSQWSAEVTVEQLFDKTQTENGLHSKLELTAVTLAALGKAELADELQLFYRAGVSKVDRKLAVASETISGSAKESKIHAILGLGLEQNFNERWFGRAEAIRLFERDEVQAYTLRVSLGYRF